LSFFDEDDEPRTRVRPRRPATAAAGSRPPAPDHQQVLLRRAALGGGILLALILLVFIVRGCQNSAQENAMRDYNQDVGALARASDQEVSEPLFNLLRNPTQGDDLSSQINGFRGQADDQYKQAQQISTPGEMTPAQRSFLMTMEMRRDGLQSIADNVRTALSSDAEAADEAIQAIAGAMSMFLASDVIYESRVVPIIDHQLQENDIGNQTLQRSQFLPGRQWIDPTTVADALGQQLSSGGGNGSNTGEPAPGLHGTQLDSVTVGDVTLDPAAANRLTYGPDTEFTVNFTNGGEHDEFDIQVTLKIEGGPEPLQVRKTVPSVAAGAAATATLGLPSDPPFGTPVTISIQIRPVPGEEKKDNNSAEYDAFFSQG
jgi:hypothetical protein